MRQTLKIRFLKKVEKTDSCWNWKGSFDNNGYGIFYVNLANFHRHILAHRVSYMLHKGKLDSKLTIDHLCRNRACVNPKHLEQVTRAENVMRGEGITVQNVKKMHCPRGHPYYEKRNKEGNRICRICQTEFTRLWRIDNPKITT